ncbi:MAG: InlB B-repeat-containing protein [Eggerthellaceae bacterium]|nr:InlB B-repeat-containing protein [Eggerthellaceae bacterium]
MTQLTDVDLEGYTPMVSNYSVDYVSAFEGCTSLVTLNVKPLFYHPDPNEYYVSVFYDRMFYNCSSLTTLLFPSEYVHYAWDPGGSNPIEYYYYAKRGGGNIESSRLSAEKMTFYGCTKLIGGEGTTVEAQVSRFGGTGTTFPETMEGCLGVANLFQIDGTIDDQTPFAGSYGVFTASSYGLVYDSNDGSHQSKSYDIALNAKPTLASASFLGFNSSDLVFIGWNTKADGSGTSYEVGTELEMSRATILYAQWAYPVIYDANGGKAGTAPEDQMKEPGKNLTLHSGKPSRDPDLTPVTTTLAYNDGSDATSELKTNRTEEWEFKGWTTEDTVSARKGVVTDAEWDALESSKKYAPGDTYSTDAELTLYAQWKAKNPLYASVALPKPADREGYDFLGWYTAAEGGTKVGDAGATITPETDATLYAHWAKKSYEVTYDANGGAGTLESDTKTYGDTLTLKSSGVSRDNESGKVTLTLNYKGGSYQAGKDSDYWASKSSDEATTTTTFTFTGWSSSADAETAEYSASNSWAYTANAAANLYAVWSSNTTGYSSYTLPDATHPQTGDKTHTFKGWTTAQYISTEWGSIPESSRWEAGASYGPVEADTTLYAVWDPPAYAIEYDANAGDDTVSGDLSAQSYTADVNVQLHAALTRTPKDASFTVTFDANGGAVSPESETATNSTTYTFKKWNTQADGGGTAYDASAQYTINADVKLYAQWEKGGSVASVNLPTPTRDGYNFLGWTEAADGSGNKLTGTYTPSDDVTLYAQWEAKTYAVTYDVNGGDADSKPADATKTHGVDLEVGAAATHAYTTGVVTVKFDGHEGTAASGSSLDDASAHYKVEYTFLRWQVGESTAYAPGSLYKKNQAATLTAQWAEETSFTGVVELPTVEREGYDFLGWYDGAGNDANLIGDAGSEYTPDATTPVTVTLHAKWKVKEYDVTYNANTDQTVTGLPDAEKKTHGETYTVSSNTPTRSDTETHRITVTYDSRGGATTPDPSTLDATVGYVFDKWNTAADGSGTGYAPGASYTDNDELALYAQWNESLSGNTVTLPAGPTHSVAGFTFQGWTTDDYKTTAWDSIPNESKWTAGADYSPTSNITLYAVWNPPVYEVSYDANGGASAPDKQYKKYDEGLTLSSEEPTWNNSTESIAVTYNGNGGSAERGSDTVTATTGYMFEKWTDRQDGDGTEYQPSGSYTPNADVTLYAQWTESTTYEPEKVKLPAADRPGYTFLGWYTAADGGEFVGDAGAEIAAPEETTTYYAQWQAYEEPSDPVSYTVVFQVPDDTDGGSVGKDSQEFTFGESQALDAGTITPPAGKVFSHWASEGGTTYTQKQLVSNLTNVDGGEVVLTAVWKDAPADGSQTYTIQYYEQGTDGSTYAMESEETIVEAVDTEVSVPESAKLAPLGFHYDETNSAPSGTVEANSSTVLTVYWARNQFDVTFEKGADDATGSMDGQHFVWASGEALTPNAFSRAGWKFTGWKVTEQNGMTAQGESLMSAQSNDVVAMVAQAVGDMVADKADGSRLTWEDNGTVTLTAQWVKDSSGGDDPDNPGGDDPDNPGGDDPDNPNKPGGDKPGGGSGDADGESGSIEKADFVREAANNNSNANDKAPSTGDSNKLIVEGLAVMALLAAVVMALSLRQSRKRAHVVGTWSAPARQAAAKRPTPRKTTRGRHVKR